MIDLMNTNFTPSNGYDSVLTFSEQGANKEGLTKALVGKCIVQADATDSRAVFELSDGSVLEVRANDGSGWGVGDFEVSTLDLVDGVIEGAMQASYDSFDDEGNSLQGYEIFVHTDKVPNGMVLVSITGYEGDGSYGSGYKAEVFAPVAGS